MLGKLITGALLVGAVITLVAKSLGTTLKKKGPRIITTSSLVRHEQFYTQSNETPPDPDAQKRLDIHFSSPGRPAPPHYCT
ncbi:MAG: hypothetical protein WBP12_03245 [Candidatus Saccharimonas sp.]